MKKLRQRHLDIPSGESEVFRRRKNPKRNLPILQRASDEKKGKTRNNDLFLPSPRKGSGRDFPLPKVEPFFLISELNDKELLYFEASVKHNLKNKEF